MKSVHFFLKYHPLHQINVLAHVLCHVTYVAAFNKCSKVEHVVKPVKSMNRYYMSKTIPNL